MFVGHNRTWWKGYLKPWLVDYLATIQEEDIVSSVWVWMRVGNGVSRGKTEYLKLGLIHQISSWMKLGKVQEALITG